MAVTSIWSVKGWLGGVVVYVENPDKTTNPAYYQMQGMTDADAQGLSDVIGYAVQGRKTVSSDERGTMRQFVSGVNCLPATARDEMMAVKKGYGKDGGVVAYHGYQSFAPGEVTPETAHEIGVKLAERLWGDKYQVLVATHLDKDSHIHSHFVVNTVSMTDGIRYHRTAKDYYDMQRASDELCREYGLSVIERTERGKSMQYAEWRAERDGQQTWRNLVRADVDAAVRESMTEKQFFQNLRRKGYEIKGGKDISVRPPGKERFVRLRRNFGDDYAIEGIRKRILAQSVPERCTIPAEPPPKQARMIGAFHTAPRITGLRALYFYYLYRMGALPRKQTPNPKRVYFLFREDIRHMQGMAREIRMMAKHGIDTDAQLSAHKDKLRDRIGEMTERRRELRNFARSAKCADAGETKNEIADLSKRIGELRHETKLCDGIARRSGEMREKLRAALEEEPTMEKESMRNEQQRYYRQAVR